MKTIAVFGGGRILSEVPDYIAAQTIGRLLAQAGYTVITGGYTGIMEAASRGAAEAGGHVIGVTLTDAERGDYPPTANAWVTEEVKCATRLERLLHLVMHADAYVVMRGSGGTAWELETVWEKMAAGQMSFKPVICVGETWRVLITHLIAATDNAERVRAMLHFTDNPTAVLDILTTAIG